MLNIIQELFRSLCNELSVPGPPTNIWFPEVTYSTAKVVWEPPTQPNGILTGYLVSYKERDGNFQGNSSDLPVTQREYTVATLQREQYYIFHVMAKTRLGWGEPQKVLVYTIINRSKYIASYSNNSILPRLILV